MSDTERLWLIGLDVIGVNFLFSGLMGWRAWRWALTTLYRSWPYPDLSHSLISPNLAAAGLIHLFSLVFGLAVSLSVHWFFDYVITPKELADWISEVIR